MDSSWWAARCRWQSTAIDWCQWFLSPSRQSIDAIANQNCKCTNEIIVNSPSQSLQELNWGRGERARLTVLWYWNWCVHRPVAWAVVVWWLYAPLAPGWLHAPAASSWWGYTVWDPHVVVHYANQPQDAAFRCWNALTAVPAVVALQCVAWYPIEFPIWHWFYDAAMWPTWALWKRLRFSHPVAPQWLVRLFKLKLHIKFSLDSDGYLTWLESEHKWLARRFNQVLLRAKKTVEEGVVGG